MALTKLDKNLLGFSDDTDFVKLPSGTTAQRPGSPVAGQFRFNTTINDAEVYDGNNWLRMGVAPPTFTSVDYPGSATALDPAGGESLVINGTQFNTGITITIGGATPSSITRNSSTQLTVTAPAKTAGTYTLVITNTDGGTATAANAVSYNGIPAFTNAAGSLGSVDEDSTVNLSAAATEPDGGAITYAITSGALPTGLSLNSSTGAITGTAPSVSADTTSNFTVTATDNENQTASRAYSITVTNVLPSGNFNTVLYTGNGSTQSITGVGFQPDLVWVKRRSNTEDNAIFDSSRGVQKQITANKTNAESTKTNALSSFDSDGFTTGANNALNTNAETYVAWCFKGNGGTTSSNTDGTITSTVQANNTLGFSIVTYTGNGSASQTVGHGLNSAPEIILAKPNIVSSWAVYTATTGTNKILELNSTAAEQTISNYWGTSSPSATTFGVAPSNANNNSSGNSVFAYCFHSVAGFSKIGSYTGTGAAGNAQNTGFEPAFVLIKRTDSSGAWSLYDNKRNTTNPRNLKLVPNSDAAENVAGTTYQLNFFTNGFEFLGGGSDLNASGGTFIYLAFAADPDTTSPTLADSFNTTTYTGNGSSQSITGLGFKPNLVWIKQRNGTNPHGLWDSVRGAGKLIKSNTTEAQTGNAGDLLGSFDSDGFQVNRNYLQYTAYDNTNYNPGTYVAWAWKANGNLPTINTDGSNETIVSANANAGFSIVKCPNIANDPGTFGHGLSSAPEMIITKRIDGSGGWQTYHTSIGTGSRLELNSSAATAGGVWNSTAPTSTVFSYDGLSAGEAFVAYCFHSVTGFSKIGSYTGTGAARSITGLGFAPNWVLLKETDGVDSWEVFDTARGAGKVLYPNGSNAEYTSASNQLSSFDSDGFSLGSATSVNENGKTYVYMAYKIN